MQNPRSSIAEGVSFADDVGGGGGGGDLGGGGAGSSTPASSSGMLSKVRQPPPTLTARARRRREEAVRRLVADVQARPEKKLDGAGEVMAVHPEAHEWLVASTVATALEKGLDRDLHTDLVQETKDNAGRIGQICHDHSEVFLASVAKVAALGGPSADLANGLQEGQRELEDNTAGRKCNITIDCDSSSAVVHDDFSCNYMLSQLTKAILSTISINIYP